jgi:cullin 3
VYCSDHRQPSIYVAAMAQFRDFVLFSAVQPGSDVDIAKILFSVILDQIRMEREGDVIDKNLIRSCVYMLEGLYTTIEEDEDSKLYLTHFEPEFLRASSEFYKAEAQTMLRDVDAGLYCTHTVKRLQEEQDRCRSTLAPMTAAKIRAVVDNELIKNNIAEVLALPTGIHFMLDNDRILELETVFQLISRVDPNKDELRKAVHERIVTLGTEINETANSSPLQSANAPVAGEGAEKEAKQIANQRTPIAVKWVDDVLALKSKYDTVLETAFKDDKVMQTSITRSFTEFINAFDRSSENLSLFFDENMKKGIKGKTEQEVDSLLEKGILLLRYIQDKDMFERYYKRHLSRRLLMKRSVSMDAERQMITKMKMEVGNTFTQRIESMFKDMAISEDLTSSYKKHVAEQEEPGTKRAEIDINVLTNAMWPLEEMGVGQASAGNTTTCIFPPSIETIKKGFEHFYLSKHSGRKMIWKPSMGTADIRAYFPKSKGSVKTRELNVSTYGMLILLLFNDLAADETLTTEEIHSMTNIPMHDLTRNLQSLAVAPKTRVLIKEPMSKDIKLTDKFSFNESFNSPFNKIRIGVVSSAKVEDADERKETEKKNDEGRAGVIEAAIVRIMKYATSPVFHSELSC